METTRTALYGGGYIEERHVLANGMVLEHSYYTNQWLAREHGANNKAGVIYVSGAKEPTLLEGILKYTKRGEDREMDAAWDAHNKMVVEYQRDEIDKVKASEDYAELPETLRALFDGKMRFDRHAGCSCPCSPGWLGQNRSVLGMGGRLNITNLEYEEERAQAALKRKAESAAMAN